MGDLSELTSDGADGAMPPGLRAGVTIGLVALVVGGLYLLAVRGEVLLADLSALSIRLCM